VIVLAEGTFADASLERARAGERADVRVASLATPGDVAVNTADAEAVIVTNNPLTAEHISRLGSGVRLIARAGIGLDAIDLDAAAERGLAVFHVPDYATAEVATHAVAMLLAVHRRLVEADAVARDSWTEWAQLKPIRPIEECTVGIVGFGRIGRAVAARVAPFAGAVQAFDPFTTVSRVKSVGSIDELASTSDFVTMHLPLTPETQNLISSSVIDALKPGAVVVNVSRGGLVDEAALCAALADGRLAGAALDVAETEPPPPDSPLFAAPRLLLSPHVAWYSEGAERRLRENVVDAILQILAGARPTVGRIALEASP
jgi:D-3-phosphoglycerate dehydrogenase / 2-oxoglutarate reductase